MSRMHGMGAPVDVAGIVAATIKTATDSIAAAQFVSPAATSSASGEKKRIEAGASTHDCVIATNTEIPAIRMEVAAVSSLQEKLALLVQYLLSDMTICCRYFPWLRRSPPCVKTSTNS